MKLVSSFIDDMEINAGECHTITFQSSAIQANFRQLIQEYFSNKKAEEYNYIKLLNNKGNKISGRNFYFIPFDCGAIHLKDDRDTVKQLREILYHYLENNPDLLRDYIHFNEQLNQFFNQIEIVKGRLKIDFQPTDKTITQLIRSLDINVEYIDGDYIPNYVMRDFLINSLLDMNILNKEVILLVSYPETDVGMLDFLNTMRLLKELKVTTLIISSHRDILTAVNPANMFLVHENGSIYDIITLKEELLELEMVKDGEDAEVAKILAYQDFKKDYMLLEDNYKKFLLSSRF